MIRLEEVLYIDKRQKNTSDYFSPLAPTELKIKLIPDDSIDVDTTLSIITNTLIIILLEYIPIYAFSINEIDIRENSSIFNNNEMSLRLSQYILPVNVPVKYLNKKYWPINEYTYVHNNKHKNDKTIVQMYINEKNESKNDIKNVTSETSKFYVDNNEIFPFDPKFPALIIKLKPGESFVATCTGILGVAKKKGNEIWASSNSFFEVDIENRYSILTIESTGQMDEYELFSRACFIIQKEFGRIKKTLLETLEDNKDKLVELTIDNIDFVFMNILNDFLQDHPDVFCSGISLVNCIEETSILRINVETDLYSIIEESIDSIIKLFKDFEKQIKKLAGSH